MSKKMPSSNEIIEAGGFVAEPVFEAAPSMPVDPHVLAAAQSLGDEHAAVPPSVMEALYDFSEQQREQMVYGVIEMENPVSYVAEAYGTTEEVVLMAIQMQKLAAETHAQEQL